MHHCVIPKYKSFGSKQKITILQPAAIQWRWEVPELKVTAHGKVNGKFCRIQMSVIMKLIFQFLQPAH